MQQPGDKEDSEQAKSTALARSARGKSPRRNYDKGVGYWLKHLKIKPSIRGRKTLERYLASVEEHYVSDLGGRRNLTAAREMLVRGTISCLGAICLTDMFLAKYGPLRPDQAKKGVLEYQPVFEQGYLRCLQQLRANLLALGLDPSEAQSIVRADYLVEQADAEPAQDPQADGDPDKED